MGWYGVVHSSWRLFIKFYTPYEYTVVEQTSIIDMKLKKFNIILFRI